MAHGFIQRKMILISLSHYRSNCFEDENWDYITKGSKIKETDQEGSLRGAAYQSGKISLMSTAKTITVAITCSVRARQSLCSRAKAAQYQTHHVWLGIKWTE